MVRIWLYVAVLATTALHVRSGPLGHWFDVQGHRGSRGEAVENTIPAFAWALMDGVTTLELDNGLTKDGVVVVSHDASISSEKCRDTTPAFKDDSLFPYVGKAIANLTLAQIKTLDCGSQRLASHTLQLLYPGTKIPTLKEVFRFALCVDTNRHIRWNIESKINPTTPNMTRGVDDFIKAQHAEFVQSGYPLSQITYQSFDWRTLIAMKARDPRVKIAALADVAQVTPSQSGGWPWLAGIQFDTLPGDTVGTKLAHGAKSIKADMLSPSAGNLPSLFTTKEMVDQAHALDLKVVPWTVNNLDVAETILDFGVDGIISDYPNIIRRLTQQRGLSVAPQFTERRVAECLKRHDK